MSEGPEQSKGYTIRDRRGAESDAPPATAAPSAAPAPGPGRDRLPPMDFSALVLSLATQGMACLGLAPLPDGSAAEVDLEGAAQTIDMLAVLEVKTKGNLTPEEFHLLRNVLTELRMHFVALKSKQRR